MGKKQNGTGAYLYFFFACITIASFIICGCGHFFGGLSSGSAFKEANDLFCQGSYQTALSKYEQIIDRYPSAGDRALFEMGIIYAYPGNGQKDYQKSLDCFQKILSAYPGSRYRQDSAEMISHIHNITIKDKKMIALQTRIADLEQDVKGRENEIASLQKKIDVLEQELENRVSATASGSADKIVIEKKKRRLTLIAKDKVLKMYKIALGGNPNGPKERQGDKKTPEGTYIIDSRNRDSRYHLSLHISYPNEKDRKRARQLGVSPGGNIMIHGLKNGFSWIDDFHTEFDWTEGCIAVTDKEIEEIDKMVPDGTMVEIKP